MIQVAWIDCDGTLIDFEDNPQWGVIDAVKSWVSSDHRVVVWSGGGKDYATTIADRYLDGLYDFALAKDSKGPTDTDIVVDDMDWNYKGVVMTPVEFILYVKELNHAV